MDKLKLCHISLALYPDRRDGASKFVRGIYDELKTRGHEITFLTAKWGTGFEDPNVVTIDIPKFRFLWVPKFALTFRDYLKTHEFDIIHSNGSRSSIPIILAKKPYIATIHDVGPFQTNFSKLPFIKWIEIKNAQHAQKIITCADSNRSEIAKFMKVDINKTYNVLSAVDPRYHPDKAKAAELKESLGLTGPVLYYVGRIEFYKGIGDILAAYQIAKKSIPDLNLVIGGKPSSTMEETLTHWKHDYPEVKFIGMVPDENMAGYYSMADAFVTYSFASEGFGLTPVEALACGTPVIASTMPAFKEILHDNALFVEPQQPQKLAKTFIKFFNDLDLGRTMVENAAPLLEQYTWKNVVDRIETIYEEYLQQKSK